MFSGHVPLLVSVPTVCQLAFSCSLLDIIHEKRLSIAFFMHLITKVFKNSLVVSKQGHVSSSNPTVAH